MSKKQHEKSTKPEATAAAESTKHEAALAPKTIVAPETLATPDPILVPEPIIAPEATGLLHAAAQDPDSFAVQISDQIESFIVAVTEVAKGDEPDSAVPFLLLEVSQLLLAGGRLGAHEDILPEERYEPDLGPERDVDDLRERLAAMLEPIDVYSEVFDPYEPRKAPVAARISDDLADVIADLSHGLAHYRAGRTTEALWWWQFSYFSNWGSTASATLRALQSLVAHVRLNQPLEDLDGLDTDEDLAEEALAEAAGKVMAEEIAGPLGLRSVQ